MAQVGVQHFELQGIPQARPGAAEYPIDKLAPPLTEGGFHLLTHLTEDKAVGGGLGAGNQQHLGLCRQVGGALGAPIAPVTEGDAPLYSLHQGQGGSSVIPIAGRQDHLEHAPGNVAQQMEFAAKEPAFAGCPKVGALVAQHPPPPLANGQAKRNGVAVNKIQARRIQCLRTGDSQQSAHLRQELLHPAQPLLIGKATGETPCASSLCATRR